MIRISSENELLESFRPIDRTGLEVPGDFRFPMLLKDYLAWVEPSGHRVYLVYEDPERRLPFGVAFVRNAPGGASPASMCEWCHSVRAGDGVGLLTATSSASRRVGLHLCRDLGCKDRVREEPGVDDLPGVTLLSARERVRRIVGRMAVFARRNLF